MWFLSDRQSDMELSFEKEWERKVLQKEDELSFKERNQNLDQWQREYSVTLKDNVRWKRRKTEIRRNLGQYRLTMTWLAWYLAHKDWMALCGTCKAPLVLKEGMLTFVPDRGFPVLAEEHDVTLQLDCSDVIVHVAWIAPTTKPVIGGHEEASFVVASRIY